MTAMTWNRNWNEDSLRIAMIDEARALLCIIDAAQSEEDIDEDQVSRRTRLTMRALTGRLVAEIIEELRPSAAAPTRNPCCAPGRTGHSRL